MNDVRALGRLAPLLWVLAALAIPGSALAATPPYRAQHLNPDIHHFHDAYYVLQHNSYAHGATLTTWLDNGLRSVELDVIDIGDWERNPNGPYVSHDNDTGNRNCSGSPDRLGHCLRDIVSWVDAHPTSSPILVFIDMKTSRNILGDWNKEEVYFLDQKVRELVGRRLYTADDLYRFATGTDYTFGAKSLRQAVSERGWPLLRTLNGKIIVAYTGGVFGGVNQTQRSGIKYIMSRPGRRLPYGFFCPDVEEQPHELVPGGTVDGMSFFASQQVVCSNLKARDHHQITANTAFAHHQLIHLWGNHVYNNDTFVYNYIAVAHGISAIGRDAFANSTFGLSIPLMGVRGSLPGYFELRPAHAPHMCMDVSGFRSRNGTKIHLWECNGTSVQQFVYTAEGQLRPRHANKTCTDIRGGDAGENTTVHLWDCDGGNSEKWMIDPNGLIRSYDKGGAYCLAVDNSGTANGTRFVTSRCGFSKNKLFTLQPVPGWSQTRF
jgi:transposase InsO family protein